MNPVVSSAIRSARSYGVVGVINWIRLKSSRRQIRASGPASSTGKSGTIAPATPAALASVTYASSPWR